MSNPTTPFSWQMPTATDLVTDLPADFEVFGQAVATSMADLLGGTTGQILSKASATDMDFTWIANDQGDITGVTAGTGITVTSPTGPTPTVAIDTTVTVDKTTAQTLTNKKLSDSTTTIVDAADATKAIKFDVAGTTGITGTIATAFTTAKTVTIPDTTGTVALTNGVINNTLTTTTGDIIYASAANTPARLGIGSSAQVLSVSGGIPAWTTPAASSKSYALLATQATTTGSSYTISGLSGYDSFLFMFGDVGVGTALANLTYIFNSDTGSNYTSYGTELSPTTTYSGYKWARKNINTQASFALGKIPSTASSISGYVTLNGANTSGVKVMTQVTNPEGSQNGGKIYYVGGTYVGTSVISSITVTTSAGSFNGGNIYVYGAA